MALTYGKQFTSKELDVSGGTTLIFTLAAGNIRNMTMLLVNHTAGAITVTAHISTGTNNNTNIFMDAESLAASERLEVNIPQMVASDELHVYASAINSITIHDLDSVVRT